MRFLFLFLLVAAALNTNAQVNNKQTEKLKEKHYGWLSCFVVKQTGDTLYGKIKYQDDYSATSDNFTYGKGWVIALKDESELNILPADIKELNIYNHTPGYRKYITIGKQGKQKVYRVIVQGTCSLLYDQRTTGGYGFYGAAGSGTIAEQTQERYYLYHKGVLSIAVNETTVANIPVKYRKKCGELLVGCLEVSRRLNEDDVYGDDLIKIVRDFNRCVDDK